MAKLLNRLDDRKIKAFKPAAKAKINTDGDGLVLVVQPNGTKLWWFRYRFANKRKTLSLGTYPVELRPNLTHLGQ